jgi:lysine-specific demethylase/histidyl-hydroxylase NO66
VDSAVSVSALGRILSQGPQQFATDAWGRRPWLSRAGDLPRNFDDLLTLHDIDEIVAVRGLRSPFVRMAKDGVVLAPRHFTASGGAGAEITDLLSSERVFAEMMDGATLILQALHRTWPPLIEFVTRLAAEIGHPVQANAYVTPARSRGFDPHYDVHDVFVLQVAGGKAWRAWTPTLELPLPAQPGRPRTGGHEGFHDQAPVFEATLAPGDALYLPRGWVHVADSLGEVSAHLTIGVHPVTRFDVVQSMASLLAHDVSLRQQLPIPLSLDDIDHVDLAAVRERMISSLKALSLDAVADELRRRMNYRSLAMPIRPLAQRAAATSAGPETPVRRRDALTARVHTSNGRVVLDLPDRQITLPVNTAQAITALLSGQPQQAGSLPGLDAADGVVVVRRLLREAVLVPDDQPPGHPTQ